MRIGIFALFIALAAFAASAQAQSGGVGPVRFRDASGAIVGTARIESAGGGLLRVEVAVAGLPPGFHGFHVHSAGRCEAPFTSAGGHHNPGGGSHPSHAGDMPVLLVTSGGVAKAEFITDRYTILSLFDVDGSAFIIHANPDNYANIPTDRYDPDPDTTTLNTGDAGPRIACGVVAPPR